MVNMILALSALLAAAQERKVVQSREFVIRFNAKERPSRQMLWVSRDGGQSWKKAREAGIVETWEDWAAGIVKCRVRVPEDGAWDFHGDGIDALSNDDAPKPGQPALPGLRIEVRGQAGLGWISPRPGEEFIGGNQLLFRWSSDRADLRPGSAALYVQLEGQPWKAVASGLETTGEHHWVLPPSSAAAKIRFRLTALNPEGREVAAPEIEGAILPGKTTAGLAWNEPRGPGEWTGGKQVTLRWSSLGLEFRERSAELQYAVGTEPWTPITRGLEASGSYLWVVPNRETQQLRLRVRALTRQGQEAAAESESVSVRVTQRPNVAQARTLYDRARVLHAQQRLTEAQLKYEESIAAWSDFGEAFNDLGKLYADLNEPARALEYFLRARKTSPSSPVAYVNAARMENRLGLHEEALADLRDALDLGVDRDERTAVLAGETLWAVARESSLAQSWKRAREACELLLKVRQASRSTRAKAEQQIEWLKARQ